ncbi:MAG: zinc-dependent metalloprotease [Bdellovibrionales bacterium]
MKDTKMKNLKLGMLSALLAMVTACADSKNIDEQDVQTVAKDGIAADKMLKTDLTGCELSVMNKGRCINPKTYLIVRTIEESNGNFPFWSVPGFSQNYGAARIELTKDRLRFMPVNEFVFHSMEYGLRSPQIVDMDEPLVEFPISKHFDVDFKRNDFGETTNKKAELEEGDFEDRQWIRVDWTKPITRGFALPNQILPSMYVAALGVSSQAQQTELVNMKEDGSFSFQSQELITSPMVGGNSYTITTRTNMVLLKDSDFSPREYSDKEQSIAGYFRSVRYNPSSERSPTFSDLKKYATVYNVCSPGSGKSCSTNQIEMALSEDMPEPYFSLSLQAIEAWNNVFKNALDREDDVVVVAKNPSGEVKQVKIGDSSVNQIALVQEDFTNGGLLGVAQFVVHPLTGEALTTRSTVFTDGIDGTAGAVDYILDVLATEPGMIYEFLTNGSSIKNLIPKTASSADGKDYNSKHRELAHEMLEHAAELGSKSSLFADIEVMKNQADIKAVNDRIKRFPTNVQKVAGLKGINSSRKNSHQAIAVDSAFKVNRTGLYIDKWNEAFNEANVEGSLKRTLSTLENESAGDSAYTEVGQNMNGFESYLTEEQIAAVQGENFQSKYLTLGSKVGKEISDFTSLGNGSTLVHMAEKRQVLEAQHGLHGMEMVSESVVRFVQKKVYEILVESMGLDPKDPATIIIIKELSPEKLREVLVKDFGNGSPIRQEIKEEVKGRVFYTTLLHEMGHSFGLRHNFIASTDVQNFHPKYFETLQKVVSGEPNVSIFDADEYAFTSVMDYNAGFHSDLMELGSYDKAAIQFAYNPEKPVEKMPKFCTDDHVADNLLCNRHDKGINLSQITQHRVDSFNQRYFSRYFRRDKFFFGNPAYGMAMNFMMPVRTVMDEYIYQVIFAPKADPGFRGLGCRDMPTLISVATGEFKVNVCKLAEVEEYLKDNKIAKGPLDMDALEDILADPNPLRGYYPMGKADMVNAQKIAKEFFLSVLGSPEPGAYIAEPKLDQDGKATEEAKLTKIPNVEPKSEYAGNEEQWTNAVRAGLAEIAQERRLNANSFVTSMMRFVTNLDYGSGKPLKNIVENDEGRQVTKIVGNLYDKYYAMLILGSRYVGVPKYVSASLNGNAYLWPQTQGFAKDIAKKMIQQEPLMAEQVVELPMLQARIKAQVPASMDKNTQYLASVISMINYINESDRSFARSVSVSNWHTECDKAKKAGYDFAKVEEQGRIYCAAETDREEAGSHIVIPMIRSVKEKKAELEKQLALVEKMDEILSQATTSIVDFYGPSLEQSPLRMGLKTSAEAMEVPKFSETIKLLTAEDAQLDNFFLKLRAFPEYELFKQLEQQDQLVAKYISPVGELFSQIVRDSLEGGSQELNAAIQKLKADQAKKAAQGGTGLDTDKPKTPVERLAQTFVRMEEIYALTTAKRVSTIGGDMFLPVSNSIFSGSDELMASERIAAVQSMDSQFVNEDQSSSANVIFSSGETEVKVTENLYPNGKPSMEQLIAFNIAFEAYMGRVQSILGSLVEVKAAPIYADRANSAIDAEMHPLVEVNRLYKRYGL